ncbi:MAG: UDP-N-acetylglucosamine 2-epimerase (non-hydrolyzing) [Bacillota bacterium]|nr:UDP-N-acetylglucosamine 2-epimerase (non-hydrolyzing) [Bacillota bacterium]MDD3298335.1 UDP-N-acetylglucosamine 2-epimerase (non-hydrolyzing) [Bacillota bacterium]MDD3850562.1 UDP-N-acetylglucosamine 2-epimerase (non-hydrolyzing) [Bacillota bacterium]MDD4707333.1 UDP-N-acetylglucosamine 2-epimerase (non-hydrolyzing) [Bacillota bacterium]
MKRIKVMTVFGTRPEAIKMAPLVKLMQKNGHIETTVCVTAQHREMLDQVLGLYDIVPDYDLDIMRERQTLTGVTVRALEGLERVLDSVKPDALLVHGDTTTTFAGSLAGFYRHVRVGHVEAGLRTFDRYSPYPEEVNRRLAGVLSDMHFAPTAGAKSNLLKENVPGSSVVVTGNTVIDALVQVVDSTYKFMQPSLKSMDFSSKRVILLTCHRRENIGRPMVEIFNAVRDIADVYSDVEVVYPVHKNPAVIDTARSILGGRERIHLIEPLDYLPFANLMGRCFMVMTDSGGIQEEAPSLGKPVLVLREVTERPEAVQAGTVRLAGVKREDVFKAASELLENDDLYNKMAQAVNPYGDGRASQRIVDSLLYFFGINQNSPKDFRPTTIKK